MKKIYLIGVVIMIFWLSSCTYINPRANELQKNALSENEEIKKVESIVIKALENKDSQLLKSIFSEKALQRADDFDVGMDYIFDLYQGSFIEITEENHSVDEHIEHGKNSKTIAAWCIIKTDVASYKLGWVDWVKQEENSEAVGVYCIQLMEYKENESYSFYDIAGIEYPERACVHMAIKSINDALTKDDSDILCEIFSSDALQSINNLSQSADRLFELFPEFKYSDKKDGWVIYSESNSKKILNAFLEINGNNEKYIMYIRFNNKEISKIDFMKFINAYEVNKIKEEINDNIDCTGIYLP